MKKLYIVKTKWGADCASDHQLLSAKFGLKMKKLYIVSKNKIAN